MGAIIIPTIANYYSKIRSSGMNTLDLFFCVVLQAAARVADPDLAYRYLTPPVKKNKRRLQKNAENRQPEQPTNSTFSTSSFCDPLFSGAGAK